MASDYEIYRARMDLVQACLERASSEFHREDDSHGQDHIDFVNDWVDDKARELVARLDNRRDPFGGLATYGGSTDPGSYPPAEQVDESGWDRPDIVDGS